MGFLALILGVLSFSLGLKAFTAAGLPLTKTKNLKGTSAKVIGVFCLLFGVLCFVDGLWATIRIDRRNPPRNTRFQNE